MALHEAFSDPRQARSISLAAIRGTLPSKQQKGSRWDLSEYSSIEGLYPRFIIFNILINPKLRLFSQELRLLRFFHPRSTGDLPSPPVIDFRIHYKASAFRISPKNTCKSWFWFYWCKRFVLKLRDLPSFVSRFCNGSAPTSSPSHGTLGSHLLIYGSHYSSEIPKPTYILWNSLLRNLLSHLNLASFTFISIASIHHTSI